MASAFGGFGFDASHTRSLRSSDADGGGGGKKILIYDSVAKDRNFIQAAEGEGTPEERTRTDGVADGVERGEIIQGPFGLCIRRLSIG